MLPATFQAPAAIVLMLGGLLSCFAGYRVFRVVLGFFGFVLGALLASSMMGTEQGLWMVGAAIVGGIIGSLILVAAYFVGVALIGAAFGALAVAHPLWAALGREPHVLVVIAFAIAGALAAMALQRYVIIVTTSYGGAWTAIVGGLALMGNQLAIEATARNNVWLAYPMNPAPGQRWVIVVFLLLGTAGLIIQLTITAGKAKKK
jgi:hypothetical protein